MEFAIEGANPAIDIAEVDHFLLLLVGAHTCKHVLLAVIQVKFDFPVVTALVEAYCGQHRRVLLLPGYGHP